jgi:hypothetical protein
MRKFLSLVLLFLVGYLKAQPPQNSSTIHLHHNMNNQEIVPVRMEEQTADTLQNIPDRIEKTPVLLKETSIQKKEKVSKSAEIEGATKKVNTSESSVQQQVQLKSMEIEQAKNKAKFQSSQRQPTAEVQLKMDESLSELERIAPESFEYNLNFYAAGNYNVNRENQLLKAAKLAPDHPEVLRFLAANAWVKADSAKTKSNIEKLVQQKVLSPIWLDYAKDLAASSKDFDVLVTHALDDSFAGYHIFSNDDKSVSAPMIVSLDLLRSLQFRALLDQNGIVLPEELLVDVKFLEKFCDLNQNRRIALSMTLPKEYLLPLKDRISPFGLVFAYQHPVHQNTLNMTALEDLWFSSMEKKVMYFSSPPADLARNYLPTLIFLRNFYRENGNVPLEQKMNVDIESLQNKFPNKQNSIKKYR